MDVLYEGMCFYPEEIIYLIAHALAGRQAGGRGAVLWSGCFLLVHICEASCHVLYRLFLFFHFFKIFRSLESRRSRQNLLTPTTQTTRLFDLLVGS